MVEAKIRGAQDSPAITQNYETIVLKPHVVNGVNIISQQDVAGNNKKFVIKWGFTLTENLVFGVGCILDFDGGFFANDEAHNYTITGNNTRVILNTDEAACLKGVYKGGTWLYPEFPLSPDEFTRDDDVIVIGEEAIDTGNLKEKSVTHDKMSPGSVTRHAVSRNPENSIADNEDLTVNENGQLQLADKEYSPTDFSGLGRVYLRKNVVQRPNVASGSWITYAVDGITYLLYWYNNVLYNCHKVDNYGLVVVNHIAVESADYDVEALPDYAQLNSLTYTESGGVITITLPDDTTITASSIYDVTLYPYEDNVDAINMLIQDMMQQAATVYIIQYDFVLGENILMEEGCILKFEGGSISAGSADDADHCNTITGLNTDISAGETKIFSIDMKFAGTWKNTLWNASWFGAIGNGVTDNAQIINAALTAIPEVNTLYFGPGAYNVSQTIKCPFRQLELDYNATIKATAPMTVLLEWFGIGQVKAYTYRRICINGGAFDAGDKANIVIACCGIVEGVISNTRIYNGITHGIYSKYDNGTHPYDYNPATFGYIEVDNVTGQHLYSNTSTFLKLGADDSALNSNGRDYHFGLVASDNVAARNVKSWLSQTPDATTYAGSVAFRIDGHCTLEGCTIDTYHIAFQFVGNHPGKLSASNISWMNTKTVAIDSAPTAYIFDGSQSAGITNTVMISNFYFHPSANALQVITNSAKLNTKDSYVIYNGDGITGNNKLQLDNLRLVKKYSFSNNTGSAKYIRIGYANASSVFEVNVISNGQRIISKLCISVLSNQITNAYIDNGNPLALLEVYFKNSSTDVFEIVLGLASWSEAFWSSPSEDMLDCTEINDISSYTNFDTKTSKNYGTRPTLTKPQPVGYCFFDTSLTPPRPIWYAGNGSWVDATGTTV